MTSMTNDTPRGLAVADRLRAVRDKFGMSHDDAAAIDDAIAEADALRERLRAVEGWISVDERLPEGWEHVEVYPDPRDDTYSFYALADGGTNGVKARRWYHNDREGYDTEIHPTHWRPLPEPPAIDAVQGRGESGNG